MTTQESAPPPVKESPILKKKFCTSITYEKEEVPNDYEKCENCQTE